MHDRIRKKMQGTAERPRLNVYRSLNHIYVQVIDDLHGKTLVSASTAEEQEGRPSLGRQRGLRRRRSGKAIAERAKAKGRHPGRVRPGRLHLSRTREGHRRDAAREAGLKF